MVDFDRAAGIGGSDVAAILGLSPFRSKTDVWMEKTRHPGYRPKPETPEMRFGRLLEPVMRAAYAEDEGVPVVEVPDTIKADDGIRFAHIDGSRWMRGIWEGKAPFQTWRNWGEGPPAYVLAQVQHYLDLTGEPFCDVTALAAGLDPIFQTWRVSSHPDLQANLRTAVYRFWEDHVLTGQPPDPLPVALEFPRHKSDLMLVAEEEDETLVERLRMVREEGNDYGRSEELIKEQLKRRIGDRAGMVGNGWRIRYKANRDSTKIDWRLVAESFRRLLDQLADDPAKVAHLLPDTDLDAIVSLYTTEQPGARPFNLDIIKEKE